jgi:hypothetical protein
MKHLPTMTIFIESIVKQMRTRTANVYSKLKEFLNVQ